MIQITVGGLFAVLENLKVDTVVIGKQAEEYENCTKFLELQKKKKYKSNCSRSWRDIIKIDKYMHFDIVWPDSENMVSDNGINNNSMTAKLVYKNFTMLFTGDIEAIAEEQIVKMYQNNNILDCDILKVAHHGSKSSSIEEIVDKITPKVSIIGVGSDNKYGHPNKDVISRLENIGSRVFRTDRDGEISIEVNRSGKIEKSLYTVKIKKYFNYEVKKYFDEIENCYKNITVISQ